MPDQFYEYFETEDAREEYHEWLDTTEDEYRHRPYDVRCIGCDTTAYGSQKILEGLGWQFDRQGVICEVCKYEENGAEPAMIARIRCSGN